ncbi:MAG: hypothetical protein MUE73_12010, partial [Planctomycetes bacterium]|nr:hypothetical protein [Planctomycetota bacterium]
MKATAVTVLAVLLVSGGVGAEQVRLRTGDLLQGEIVSDRTDENVVAIRLYSTGGEFTVRWDQLTPEDEKRLRDSLGLTPWNQGESPVVPGHLVLFKSGEVLTGVAENPADRSRPLRVRTTVGSRDIPWDTINEVRETEIEALTVYTPDELAAMYMEEMKPASAADWFGYGKKCVQAEAYAQAADALRRALEDTEFASTEQGGLARNTLARVEILVKAADALKRVRDVKNMGFQKRFDAALAEIGNLRKEYEANPAILKLLELDRLERQVAGDRRKHFITEVRRRFFNLFEQLVSNKVREKDPDDRSRDISAKAAVAWAVNPKGLGQEIFTAIAEQTGLAEPEAREFWTDRGRGQTRRFSYGGGTFNHPEVAAKVQRVLSPAAARASPGSSRQPVRAGPRATQMKVKT